MAISQNFPDVRPSLNLNFARSKTLDPRITFERASIGTYVDENGLIKTAAADEARFDHDPETGESLGLLIEESRTNLITYSDDISSWGTSNVSVVSESVSNPFGYSSVYRVRGSSSLNRGHSISPGGSVPANTPHTTSVYVKGEGTGIDAGKIQLRIGGIGFGVGVVNFDLFTNQSNTPEGLSGTSNSSDTWSINDYGMEFVGDDWYRIWMTHQSDNTSAVSVVTITSLSAKDNPSLNRIFWYTAPNTGGFYIAGAQLESGSFKTSVIPTSGSTVTREPDITKITGTNFSSWYNQNEGTILYESALTHFPRNLAYRRLFSINAGTGGQDNVIHALAVESNTTVLSAIWNNSSPQYTQYSRGLSNYVANDLKFTIGYKDNDVRSYMESAGILDTVGDDNVTIPKSMVRFDIGHVRDGNHPVKQHVKKIRYYPTRLTNSQLQNLTK